MVKIFNRHLYHGSALLQVAEHEEFTSINRVDLDHTEHHSAFEVNEGVGIFLKYATTPTDNGEYQFGFTGANLDDIDALKGDLGDAYAVLVIHDAIRGNKEICCITHYQLFWLKRQRDARIAELRRAKVEGVTVYVRVRRNRPFYVSVKYPDGSGGNWYYEVPKNSFPNKIFG